MKLLVLVFYLCAGSAFAQLTWEKTELSFYATPEDKSVVARYKFINSGAKPIKIDSVMTSCGCTTAALTKKNIFRGNPERSRPTMSLAVTPGARQKSIWVSTSAEPGQPIVLKLHVYIQERISIEPQLVYWRVGEPPDPKAIRISIAGEDPIKVLSVTSDNPAIKVNLKELKSGREYEAQVTPDNATKEAAATLTILTNFPPSEPQKQFAYARVK